MFLLAVEIPLGTFMALDCLMIPGLPIPDRSVVIFLFPWTSFPLAVLEFLPLAAVFSNLTVTL